MKQFLTTFVCILGLCGMQAAQAAAQEKPESSISLEYNQNAMKQFLTTIVCILGLCGMQAAQAAAQERAESSISLEYKMVEDRDLYRLMDFLDVYRLDVKVIGEGLKGREFRVVTVTCKDSVFTETGRERSGIIVSADSDTLDFIFFARQTCPDTVLLSWTLIRY